MRSAPVRQVYGTVDDTPGKPTARHLSTTVKISYQATTKHKFIGFWQDNPTTSIAGADRFAPDESNLEISIREKPNPSSGRARSATDGWWI